MPACLLLLLNHMLDDHLDCRIYFSEALSHPFFPSQYLDDNKIKVLPVDFGRLKKLRYVSVRGRSLKFLSSALHSSYFFYHTMFKDSYMVMLVAVLFDRVCNMFR